ncbi:hypothetical protein GCM10025298_07210 [Natronobiforma cellulositropha]
MSFVEDNEIVSTQRVHLEEVGSRAELDRSPRGESHRVPFHASSLARDVEMLVELALPLFEDQFLTGDDENTGMSLIDGDRKVLTIIGFLEDIVISIFREDRRCVVRMQLAIKEGDRS